MNGISTNPFLFLFSVSKQFADVCLRLPHVLVEDLRAVDDLRFPGVQHLSDLTSHQCLSSSRRTVQQDSTTVLQSWEN